MAKLDHDEVLEDLADELAEGLAEGERICTNPGPEHNCGIKGLYPDLIVARKKKALRIYEVETEDSMNDVAQWENYAALGVPFTLIIPAEKLDVAEGLLDEHGIEADIMTYELDDDGDIVFE